MTPVRKTGRQKSEKHESSQDQLNNLILHNDDVNTFEYVITCLVDICCHEPEQAEQCAMITHYNGKCDIKKGTKPSLLHMKRQLTEMGLSVTIE